MDTSAAKRAYGSIVKKEILASFQTTKPLKEMVLEARQPFPGYYSRTPSAEEKIQRPYYVFFVVKPTNLCTEDNIIRITQKIKQSHKLNFDACPGQLSLFNIMQPHIRIHTDDLKIIPKLIELYRENGIVFQKHKEVAEYTSLIRIKKYFLLDEVFDGVYRASDNQYFRYIRIPRQIEWDDFEKITMTIKNTYNFNHYDYALAAFYQECGFEDYVRIYSEHCDCDNLPELRMRYVEEIEKHHFI